MKRVWIKTDSEKVVIEKAITIDHWVVRNHGGPVRIGQEIADLKRDGFIQVLCKESPEVYSELAIS